METKYYKGDTVRIFDDGYYDLNHLMAQLDGSTLPSSILSVGHQMLIVFLSDYSDTKRGFKANIIIEDANVDNATNVCTVTNPCDINQGHCHYDGQCAGVLRCGQSNCPHNSGYSYDTNCCYDYCGQFLDMATGVLRYPNVGEQYDNMQNCSWLIEVASDQIIAVELTFLGVSCRHTNNVNLNYYSLNHVSIVSWMTASVMTMSESMMATLQLTLLF